jgi:ribosomal protein L21E
MSGFLKDFKDANADFSGFKKELLSYMGGDLVNIETNDSQLANMFDQYSGIDAFQVVDKQLRGVAIRVQWGNAWNTFTIRYKRASGAKTEYQKRSEAILNNKGYLYPYLTIQAYLDKRGNTGEILSCCVIKTEDLYKYLFSNMPSLKTRKCPEGNEFLYVDFDELKKHTKNIITFGSYYSIAQAA